MEYKGQWMDKAILVICCMIAGFLVATLLGSVLGHEQETIDFCVDNGYTGHEKSFALWPFYWPDEYCCEEKDILEDKYNQSHLIRTKICFDKEVWHNEK